MVLCCRWNMKELNLRAYAKVNLALDVVRKREDGYHEVSMVMQMIKLYDRLKMKPLKEDTIKLTCNLNFLPVNENNLVYQAVKMLKEE